MKKLVMFITIFVSVILMQFIFVNNVKADSIINGITVSDDFYFPRYEDIVCPPSESNCSDTLLNIISSNYNGNYHLQCWYSITSWSGTNIPNNDTHSEIYCYVGDISFVPYVIWQNGQYTNQYNPDGFTLTGTPWINSSNKNSYQSLAIYRWNYDNYTWDTICANWSNSCIYNVIGDNQYPIVNYSSVDNDTSTPIFKTDIWYTSERWNAPLFQGNLRPRPITNLFNVDFIQGPVIMSNYDGRIANLVSYYVKPTNNDIDINDYKFCYIESSGGFRDSENCFELKYYEPGEVINNERYYYYYNLPLFYNITLTYNIYNSENDLIQTNNINAYLSDLPTFTDYAIYNFKNYEYANMSGINTGKFAISSDLINNVEINVINYDNDTKVNFLLSNYYDSNNSYVDSNGYQWYSFNFNNEHVYLQIINKVNDITDFWAFVDNYDLKLVFPISAYVHLSGNASSDLGSNNIVNQQSYIDSNGDIHYIENPIKSDFSDTSGFLSHFEEFFPNLNTENFGLTSIITSPLIAIRDLFNSTCYDILLPIPYTNQTLPLPCMTNIYKFYFPLLYEIIEIIIYGYISYRVIVDIYFTVNRLRYPDLRNEIEVVDL